MKVIAARLWRGVVSRCARPVFGYAVRRVWGGGRYELIDWRSKQPSAEKCLWADRGYWWRGPVRPVGWALVAVGHDDYRRHRKSRVWESDIPALRGLGAVPGVAVTG